MFAAFITSFRETLEASIVISIILAYLNSSGNSKYRTYIWTGVALGVIFSFLLAYLFETYFGGFEGEKEALFEMITSFLAAGFIVWTIIWMIRHSKNLNQHIREKTQAVVKDGYLFGLTMLAFIGVAREGIEIVLFLQPLIFKTEQVELVAGVMLGILLACVLAYLLYKGILKFSLKLFFNATTLFLILFAGWLVANGIHEIFEVISG